MRLVLVATAFALAVPFASAFHVPVDTTRFQGRLQCTVGLSENETDPCRVDGSGNRVSFTYRALRAHDSLDVLLNWTAITDDTRLLTLLVWPPGSNKSTSFVGANPLRVNVPGSWSEDAMWRILVVHATNRSGVEIDQPFRGTFAVTVPDHAGRPLQFRHGTVSRIPEVAILGPQAVDPQPYVLVGGLILAVLAAWAARFRLQAFGVVLFSRLARAELLDHPRRRMIFERTQQGPITADRLRRELGLRNGVFEHHLRVLLRGGLVRRVMRWGHPVIVAAGAEPRAELRDRLLELAAGEPGVTVGDAAARLGTTPRRLRYHLRQLVERGFVRADLHGRALRLHATTKTPQ